MQEAWGKATAILSQNHCYQRWIFTGIAAVYLVIHLKTVHRRVAALKGRRISMAACRQCAAGNESDDHENADGKAPLFGHVFFLDSTRHEAFMPPGLSSEIDDPTTPP